MNKILFSWEKNSNLTCVSSRVSEEITCVKLSEVFTFTAQCYYCMSKTARLFVFLLNIRRQNGYLNDNSTWIIFYIWETLLAKQNKKSVNSKIWFGQDKNTVTSFITKQKSH